MKRDKRKVEVRNPRYEGAAPEDVARAMLRQVKEEKGKKGKGDGG